MKKRHPVYFSHIISIPVLKAMRKIGRPAIQKGQCHGISQR